VCSAATRFDFVFAFAGLGGHRIFVCLMFSGMSTESDISPEAVLALTRPTEGVEFRQLLRMLVVGNFSRCCFGDDGVRWQVFCAHLKQTPTELPFCRFLLRITIQNASCFKLAMALTLRPRNSKPRRTRTMISPPIHCVLFGMISL
jgi:hypothetical protein